MEEVSLGRRIEDVVHHAADYAKLKTQYLRLRLAESRPRLVSGATLLLAGAGLLLASFVGALFGVANLIAYYGEVTGHASVLIASLIFALFGYALTIRSRDGFRTLLKDLSPESTDGK